MADVYKKLARKLDKLPQGYPSTDSGVELKILRKIFSPEDAEMAARLRAIPETAGRAAKRLGMEEGVLRATLDDMVSRGQIVGMKVNGSRKYALAPFVVGIFEFQVSRMDRELAELCDEYWPHFARSIGSTAPSIARVVPVNRHIDAKATVLAYEDTRKMIEGARSFMVTDCICRKEKALLGKTCHHKLETCLSFSKEENAYEGSPREGRTITREEALTILDESEDQGLVHCTYNFEHGQMFVCNCCSCCCGFLGLLTEYDTPHGLVRSNWQAVIDEEHCATCGVCGNERCPVEAVDETDGGDYRVNEGRCIGCGVCVVSCPTEAMQLVERPESERTVPPRNIVDWSVQRAANRSGPVKAMALRGWLAWRTRRVSR